MTIKKGEAWGEPGLLPSDGVVARSDRAISRALEEARARNAPFPTFGIVGGDLRRTLGGTGALTTTYPIDVGEALIDGRHHYFVAHLVARDRGWRHVAVAMNAQWLGEWNLGPRAHPNDGVLDTYKANLGLADRLKVRKRLPTGSHLPHPGIAAERGNAVTIELSRPLPVYVDGERVGVGRTLALRVLPDALRTVA
ncbi:MAG: hypothetical protein QOF21_479 [Actinomycetota bacterium]